MFRESPAHGSHQCRGTMSEGDAFPSTLRDPAPLDDPAHGGSVNGSHARSARLGSPAPRVRLRDRGRRTHDRGRAPGPATRMRVKESVNRWHEHDPRLGWRSQREVRVVSEPPRSVRRFEVRTSAWGLREDRELPPEPPPGKRRVAILGDSFAFGYCLERSEAFPGSARESAARQRSLRGPELWDLRLRRRPDAASARRSAGQEAIARRALVHRGRSPARDPGRVPERRAETALRPRRRRARTHERPGPEARRRRPRDALRRARLLRALEDPRRVGADPARARERSPHGRRDVDPRAGDRSRRGARREGKRRALRGGAAPQDEGAPRRRAAARPPSASSRKPACPRSIVTRRSSSASRRSPPPSCSSRTTSTRARSAGG